MLAPRPDNIGKIFGQDHLTDLLISWTEDINTIPKSVLFSGPYGTGKTTVARILANKLVSSKTDIKEINAADARGIEDVRSWAESAKFSPLGTGGRVYIMDELHQMTTAAQSALLKVIEEPPSKIYFFLCTTEPSKLLPAIRSRCTALELKLLQLEDTRGLLASVFRNKIHRDILDAIHYKSGGHARDAVKMAEIAVTSGIVNKDELTQKVGFGRNEIENIIVSLFRQKTPLEKLRILTNIQDVDLVCYTLDNVVDAFLTEGHEFIISAYGELLHTRIMRREHKANAIEQIYHFMALYVRWANA
jgi:DNA polymerase-3 subunit gamma/tau